MLKEVRLQAIYQEIKDNEALDMLVLAERFKVSTDTIRRDLSELANRGLIQKVRGGAMAKNKLPEAVAERASLQVKEKREIGRKALQLLRGTETILLEGGTTNLALAEQLPANYSGTVLTNSLPIAAALCQHPDLELIVLGGRILKTAQISIGMEVCEAASLYNPDIYFLATHSLHAKQGLSGPNREEALQKQWLIRNSVRVVSLLTEDKFQTRSDFQIASVGSLDAVVTTDKAKPKLKKLLADTKLIVV